MRAAAKPVSRIERFSGIETPVNCAIMASNCCIWCLCQNAGPNGWSAVAFLKRIFLRRHVYEHNGAEVDQVYLEKSGDTTVRLKQHISETVESVHQLLGNLDRMVRNLQEGFHELLPPLEAPIKSYEDRLAREKRYKEGRV